jgi:hypothetical protein
MSKLIRVIIVVAALGLIALVSSQVVQASWGPHASAPKEAQNEVQLPKQEEVQISEPNDTQPEAMGQDGTTRPPNCEGLVIPVSGEYSLCGVAVVEVEINDEGVEVIVDIEALPTDLDNVLAGTVNLKCLVDGEIHEGRHDEHAEPVLCFAAPPDKEVVVKFYDESAGSWTSVETTVAAGQACAPANYSGKYVLVEK